MIKFLFVLGIVPFILPLVLGIYHVWLESWSLLDWMILYSYVYWPTYLVGLTLMIFSIFKMRKRK